MALVHTLTIAIPSAVPHVRQMERSTQAMTELIRTEREGFNGITQVIGPRSARASPSG